MRSVEELYTREARLMGCQFSFGVVAADPVKAAAWLDLAVAEMQRIERLLTVFDPASEVSQVNAQAGLSPVKVSPEVYALIGRCQTISRLSQGAFDLTAGALQALYQFKRGEQPMPDRATRAEALRRTGYQHIRLLPPDQVMLVRTGMRIGFGAVGKGYGADATRKILTAAGVRSGWINASGDLTAWGTSPGGAPWRVGIANPRQPDQVLHWLPVDGTAVATSGDYEQYVTIGGVRYAHTVNPRTGYPVRGVQSVTIVSPSAELSDALATAVTVMGPQAGLYLIDQLPDTHCLVIDEKDVVYSSRNLTFIPPPA
ncbi:MAG: FAD:protein FMN transferase [Bacteroidia bacterium]|nr:FAD:protein FMN transferase [Bacteroidia bacterium]